MASSCCSGLSRSWRSAASSQWHQRDCNFGGVGGAQSKRSSTKNSVVQTTMLYATGLPCRLGFVELCAKILQIMHNDFKDYACTFCQLFLSLFAKNVFRFCITHSRIQERPILCLWDRQNSLPPSSKTSDFLYCLARLAALTLAES